MKLERKHRMKKQRGGESESAKCTHSFSYRSDSSGNTNWPLKLRGRAIVSQAGMRAERRESRDDQENVQVCRVENKQALDFNDVDVFCV